MSQLTLEATDVKDAQHWYWRLNDEKGYLIDHTVALDQKDWQYWAFLDLYGYLKEHAAPGRWAEDEKRIVDQVGVWIGEKVLGPIGPKILARRKPATVRVVIPGNSGPAKGLQHLPFELAQVNGKPLALQDVSLIFEVQGESQDAPEPMGERLRMLAVFSLPTGPGALNLRHERYRLQTMIRSIAHRKGLAIDLRVLQYGVTREALGAILDDGEGWDIIHFSGHGLAAGLVLEKPDGTTDLVSTDDVIELLGRARTRLKWVTLSACLSAAATVAETLHWLGLDPKRDDQTARPDAKTKKKAAAKPKPTKAKGKKKEEPKPPENEPKAEPDLPAVAQSLVREIGCAVLAMRYPVGDEFAIDLTEQLYRNVLEQRQPLPKALQLALTATSPSPLAGVTPALFGKLAVDLHLKAPDSDPDHEKARPSGGLAGFPDPPERFVGRVRPMIEAGKALAPEGDWKGVLFHGMSGAGKTACAVELAHHYGDLERFTGFVWYKAPTEGSEIAGSLGRFAQAFETQLSDENLKAAFPLLHIVAEAEEKFDAYLPRLRKFLEGRSVLIVLDNLETLLRPDGQWRDPRWGKLVATLVAHRGESRTVLTSCIRPILPVAPGVSGGPSPQSRLLEVPIHSLTLDEAALLARQLPNLGALLRAEGIADDQERERRRRLVASMLNLVQGHPKLIELAEGQAADPSTLESHLVRANVDWNAAHVDANRLGAFFREGESSLEAGDFLQALAGWTTSIVATLPAPSRTMFHFLACLEDGDRDSWVVGNNWSRLWKRLSLAGDPPDLAATLAPLVASGLVDVQALGPADDAPRAYAIHPGVAEAGRSEAGNAFQEAVDVELAAFWRTVYDHGRKNEMSGLGHLVIRGGLAAAPYLMRQRRWDEASTLLEQAINRDRSPTTLAAVLPLLVHIAGATRGTERSLSDAGVLARALSRAGRRREAEALFRSIMDQAATREEYRTASAVAGDLVNLLWETGRSEEALGVVDFKMAMTGHAGFGPWTQLSDEGRRLQLLAELGRYDEVLAEVEGLLPRMEQLPDVGDQEEAVNPWNVRELILDTGHTAARRLGRWERALALSEEIRAVEVSRGASGLEIARGRFNDYGPLLRLQRHTEARNLLLEVRGVFERAGDLATLGATFSALADLEAGLGRPAQAAIHEQTALRYKYSTGEPEGCAISHFNLANYLIGRDGPSASSLAHRLASGLIRHQTAAGRLANSLQALSWDLASFDPAPPPVPSSFAELCQIVEQEEGVRFAELFATLPTTRAATGDEALQKVLELARSQP